MDLQTQLAKARALQEAGDLWNAGRVYQQILHEQPNNADALHGFGVLHHHLNYLEQGWQFLVKSLEINPDRANVWVDFAALLFQAGDMKGCQEAARNAQKVDPKFAPAPYWLGALEVADGNPEAALPHFEKALSLDPNYLPAYKEILARKPENPEGEMATRLKEILEFPDANDDDKALIHSILAGLQEKAGNIEAFFEHLNKANGLQHKQCSDWQDDHRTYYCSLKSNELFNWFSETIEVPRAATPIFILSLPRSGSTLLEQMLSSHPLVSGGGEMHFLPNLIDQALMANTQSGDPRGLKNLPKEALDWVSATYQQKALALVGQTPFFTDKLLWNFERIGHIRKLFPHAKILHIKRNPMDCGFSIYKHFFQGQFPYLCNHQDYAWYRRQYENLMAHWHQVFPGTILDVEYETLVDKPEETMCGVLEFCGLDWNPAVLDFHKNPRPVATLSLSQVREPLNKKGIGKTKKYQSQLKELETALKDEGLL